MPWSCPACGNPIKHNLAEARPRFGVLYRCHPCRLDLVMDPATITLVDPADEVIVTDRTPSGQT